MQEWKIKQSSEYELDLHRILTELLRRWYVLVAAALVGALVAFIYTAMFIPTTYRTGFSAYVNSKTEISDTEGTTTNELNSSIMLMRVYSDIITSRTVLTEAASLCQLNESYGKLGAMVTVEKSTNTPVIRVYVEAKDPAVAAELASAIAQVAPKKVAEVVEGGTMSIIDPPIQPSSPYSPNRPYNTLLGTGIGLGLSVFFLVILDVIYDKVNNAEDLENRYGIVVIGKIPDMDAVEKRQDKYAYAKTGSKHR